MLIPFLRIDRPSSTMSLISQQIVSTNKESPFDRALVDRDGVDAQTSGRIMLPVNQTETHNRTGDRRL